MNNKHTSLILNLALVLALTVVSSASALTVDTSIYSNTEGSVSSNGSEGQTDTKATSSADVSASLRVTADEVRSEGNEERPVSAIEVASDADLSAYAETVVREDETISEVDASAANEVVVTYKRPAKLFGLFKVNLEEEARVTITDESDVSVTVDRPWWEIFVENEDYEEFRAALEARVKNALTVTGSATLTASQKALILSEIQTAAEASYNAEAEAEAEME